MSTTLLWLDPKRIQRDADNVRQELGDVAGLAETMRQYGVLQPLGVRRDGPAYTVVYGNRRREAAVLADLEQVPYVVVDESGARDGFVRQLLENVQRQQLNDLDQSRAFRRLIQEARAASPELSDKLLHEQVGRTIGLSASTVQRYLGLLDLAPGAQAALAAGTLTITQAQHLRALKEPRRQDEVASFAVRERLSAAQISRLCAVMVRQPHLTVEAAAEIAASRLPLGSVPVDATEAALAPKPLPRPSIEDEESDDDFWGPEGVADDDAPRGTGQKGNTTADGNRRLRIRSVASFCDEVGRLAQCLQDGDLLQAARTDGEAPMKLRLALRQLQFATRALEAMAKEQGWVER